MQCNGYHQPHNKSVHTSSYCCESAFSTMNKVKNKYRSTLTNEHLHQCLRLAFTPFMPKFKPQKNTNKATSPFVHSSNIFVGVMFLNFDRHCSGPWTEWKFGEWTFWVSN